MIFIFILDTIFATKILNVMLKDDTLKVKETDAIYKKSSVLRSLIINENVNLKEYSAQSFRICSLFLDYICRTEEERRIAARYESRPFVPRQICVPDEKNYLTIEDVRDAFLLIDFLDLEKERVPKIQEFLIRLFFISPAALKDNCIDELKDQLRPKDLDEFVDYKYFPFNLRLKFKGNVGYNCKRNCSPPPHGEIEDLETRNFLILDFEDCEMLRYNLEYDSYALEIFLKYHNIQEIIILASPNVTLDKVVNIKNIKKIIFRTEQDLEFSTDRYFPHITDLKFVCKSLEMPSSFEYRFRNLISLEIDQEKEGNLIDDCFPGYKKLETFKYIGSNDHFLKHKFENENLKNLYLNYFGRSEFVKSGMPNLKDLRIVKFQWLNEKNDSEIISKAEKLEPSLLTVQKLIVYFHRRAKTSKSCSFSAGGKLLLTLESLNPISQNLRTNLTNEDWKFIYDLIAKNDKKAWENLSTRFVANDNGDQTEKKNSLSFLITLNDEEEVLIYGPFN